MLEGSPKAAEQPGTGPTTSTLVISYEALIFCSWVDAVPLAQD